MTRVFWFEALFVTAKFEEILLNSKGKKKFLNIIINI